MPTTRRSTLVSSSSPLEASRSHRRRRPPPPPPRPCRHRNASSPSSFVVRVLSNRSTRVCFLFSVFFFRVAVERKKERNRVGFRVSVLRTRRRCVFITREKRSAPVAREGSFRRTTVGARLVRRRRRRRRSVCAHHQSFNQSIDSKKKKKKKRVASSSIIKSHLSPVGKTHPTDSLTTVFSSASSSASSQPRPRSLPPPLVGHSHFLLSCNRCADFLQKRETISRERRLDERRVRKPLLYLRTNDVFSSLLFFPPPFFFFFFFVWIKM